MVNLAVIIPTFNRKVYLNKLLSQIFDISHGDFKINVIVVVDGSTDGTLEVLSKNFHQVHVVKGTGNWWYTKSINNGLAYAKRLNPNYILTLNDDILLKNNFFEVLNNAIKHAPKDSLIGALSLTKTHPEKILSAGVKNIIRWRHKLVPYYKMFTDFDTHSLKGLHPSLVLPGRGLLVPYKVFKILNGFDEKFTQYHSDFDFCLRAQKRRYESFVSWDAIVYAYIEQTSSGTSFLKIPFKSFIKGFTNKNSRIYIPANARYIYRHGIKILFPLTFLVFILATFKANFFNPKING